MLPQLRALDIVHGSLPCQPQWQAILAGAAAAGGLTKLTLDTRVKSDRQFTTMDVAACASVTRLTCLQDLTVGNGNSTLNLLHGDALALTALTPLTRLILHGAKHGIGTGVATALARSLRQLQSLDLGDCCLQLDGAEGLACLEAIGRLTQLTRLILVGNEGLTQQGLMQLTRLSRLQQEWCGHLCSAGQVTHEALSDFWAAVHAQQS
jgi:hypothetical protein